MKMGQMSKEVAASSQEQQYLADSCQAVGSPARQSGSWRALGNPHNRPVHGNDEMQDAIHVAPAF